MCGRFTLRTNPKTVADHFGLPELPLLEPRYNIAPRQPVDIIREVSSPASAGKDLAASHVGLALECSRVQWGLVPPWAKDAGQAGWINVRSETAAARPAFRSALRYRRCLVPADGFYEWKKRDGCKQPYFIHFRDDRLFAFAGLWEYREADDGSVLESCVIMTTAPNSLMLEMHDRMPVILPPSHYTEWLNPDLQDPAPLQSLLCPYPADEMEAFPVGNYVNATVHEGPRCLQRDEGPGSLF